MRFLENLAMKAIVNESSMAQETRPGHLNFQILKTLQNQQMVLSLPEIKETSVLCEGCTFGKQHISSFPTGQAWRASVPLELIHSDVYGPMKTATLGGNKYFLIL